MTWSLYRICLYTVSSELLYICLFEDFLKGTIKICIVFWLRNDSYIVKGLKSKDLTRQYNWVSVVLHARQYICTKRDNHSTKTKNPFSPLPECSTSSAPLAMR